jgi:hypothetical protein
VFGYLALVASMDRPRRQAEQGCLSAGLTVVGIFGILAGIGGLFTDYCVLGSIVGAVSILILWHQHKAYRRPASGNGSTALGCLVLVLGSHGCTHVPDRPPRDSRPNVASLAVLEGQPSWLPIGPEVYQEADITDVEQTRLSVRMEPRWFRGFGRAATLAEFEANLAKLRAAGYRFDAHTDPDDRYVLPDPPPYPRRLADLPLEAHGVQLALNAVVQDVGAGSVVLELTLSGDRALVVEREVEHRFSNTLPLLFAFYVDGKAVRVPFKGSRRWGGVRSMVSLMTGSATRTWSVDVDGDSLRALLPDARPHRLTVVATFCNQQHIGYDVDGGMSNELSAGTLRNPNGAAFPAQVLVRSGPVTLVWDGQAWASPVRDEDGRTSLSPE